MYNLYIKKETIQGRIKNRNHFLVKPWYRHGFLYSFMSDGMLCYIRFKHKDICFLTAYEQSVNIQISRDEVFLKIKKSGRSASNN